MNNHLNKMYYSHLFDEEVYIIHQYEDIDQQQIEIDQMKRDQYRQEQQRERDYNRWQVEKGEQDKYQIGSDQNTNSVICHYLDPDC